MATPTHVSPVFDQRNKYIDHPYSNKKTSKTHDQFPQKNIRREQLHPVQEWRSMKTKNIGIRPSYPNGDDEVQPFVEEPVPFDFGRDYGTYQLFCESQKELVIVGLPYGHGGRGFKAVKGIKYSDDDIYILSSSEDMINCFFRDNLF